MAINRNFIVDAGLEVKTSATVTTSLQAGSLTVLGVSNQVGAAVFANTVAITGAATVSNILTMNQSNTTGSANVGGILNVVGNTTIGGFANVVGTFRAASAANVLSTFGIGGAANALSTLGVTGATTLANTLSVTGNATFSNAIAVTGLATFSQAVVIQGNLIVSGTTTSVNTQTLNVADNLITLNSDWIGVPTENAGMEVNRGTSANVALIWNEAFDRWEVTNNGTNYGLIHSTLRDVVLGTETSGAYVASATSTTPALGLSTPGGEGSTITGSIRTASTSLDGIVTLTDSISNTSVGVAGSASAVKSAYDNAVTYTNGYASNASNISSGTLAVARLATSGVTAAQYGSSSVIPVITVDAAGRVTAATTAAAAVVTGYSFTAANNTLTISTGNGTFSANVNGLTGTFGINISGTAATANNSSNFGAQPPGFYTDIISRLGYTPVQQGGGTSQLANKLYIGWNGSQLGLQIDSNNFGGTWPIGISGTAAFATTAGTANALNPSNSYQGVNFTATGRFLAGNGSVGAPSIAFSSDGSTDTGFYWTADGFINMTNNGVYSGQFGPGGTLATVGAMTASQFNGSGAGLTGTAASLTAGAANAVAWTNVSGRPTNVSTWVNDSGYITTDGRAYPRRSDGTAINFIWDGQPGQPTWLWGGNDGVNFYVYNPSNFSVSYAASAGNSSTVGGLSVHAGTNNEANRVVRTDGSGYIQAGYIHSAAGNEANNSNPPRVWGTNGSDSYLRTYLTSALSVGFATNASNITATSGLLGYSGGGLAIETAGQGGPQVQGQSGGAAMISFHRPGSFAINFGLGTDNQLRTGGWSRGGTHVILDSGNYNSYAPTLTGGNASGTWGINITGSAGSAGSVAWTNVSGRPTNLSEFTNGPGYITSSGSITGSAGSVAWTNVSGRPTTVSAFTNDSGYITSTISGNMTAADFIISSDDRLKIREGNLQSALAAVNSLNGFRFTWNDRAAELRNFPSDVTRVGVSAQEVEAILPEAVYTDDAGYKTVSYDSIIPLLIEAVKELTAKVAELESK